MQPSNSGNFQLSPDFRQRASSNASSCGRLSPIQSIVGVDNVWNYTPVDVADLADNADQAQGDELELDIGALDQLAGSLADELTLQQNDFFKGSVWFHHHPTSPNRRQTSSFVLRP
uniref:Uncharacterized protein n=1 Tax=Anopheles maculatus TaxID=74869 RepID=A0A182TB22_9DIPT